MLCIANIHTSLCASDLAVVAGVEEASGQQQRAFGECRLELTTGSSQSVPAVALN